MFFLPLVPLIILFLFLMLPVLFFLLQLQIVGAALTKLGLRPEIAVMIFFLSLLGSMINIPITSRPVESVDTSFAPTQPYYWRTPHMEKEQIIAINVGGAIIPLLLCLYLLPRAPLLPTVIATMISTIVCYAFARPVPHIGVTIPIFIPPLVAIGLAFIFSPRNRAPVAYISGVLGVLIGADLMNLSRMQGAGIMSIGGAGVFDGIFLVGIIAALFS